MEQGGNGMADLSDVREAILAGDAPRAAGAARGALASGAAPAEIVAGGIGPALEETGKKFEEGEFFVPELLMAARATKGVFEILRPLLAAGGSEPAGTVVPGTVRGDQHDIGKNLVGAMLEGAGFEVTDLGVDVAPETFVDAVRARRPQILGLSALLTTTLPSMKDVVDALGASGLREGVRVLVGGAPVTAEFAAAIGADGYGESASDSVEVARRQAAALRRAAGGRGHEEHS